jgi:C4-type Zn-finger protein
MILDTLFRERHYCETTHRQAMAVSTGAMTGQLPKCSECGYRFQEGMFTHEFKPHTNTSRLPPAIYRSVVTLKRLIPMK